MSEDQPVLLVVDDNPEMTAAIRRALRNRGYRILLTNDPRQAVDMLASEPVDVLLSDVDMPNMSGHEVVAAARKVRPEAVRVLVTGQGTMEAAVRAINEGEVHRFVRKPFDTDELREIVAQALLRKKELGLASEASALAERRRLLMAQLEEEHEGITGFARDGDGVYMVDLHRAFQAAALLGMDPFLKPSGS